MALIAENVAFKFDRKVLDGVPVSVEPGQILAILGPNGVGKTTLLRLLSGFLKPQGGSVELDGRAVSAIRPRERARRIVSIAQRPQVAFSFSVRQVVALGAFALGGGLGPEGADRVLSSVQLLDRAEEPFASLSEGQRQRVALARALVQLELASEKGSFLLADEPFSAMDPRYTSLAQGLVRSLADRGVGIGIVLHDLALAGSLADRGILLAESGRVVREGPMDEVLDPGALSEVFGVEFAIVRGPDGPLLAPRMAPGLATRVQS